MPEMRITITDFHNDWGGQALQVLLLGQALAGVGHAVTLAVPPESELARRGTEAGLSVDTACTFRRGFRPLTWWRDLRALAAGLRRRETEVVHCHGSQDTWLALAARHLLGCRVALVRTKHNSYPVQPHLFNRWLYRRGVDRLITVAGSIEQDLLATGLVNPERVRTIHAGLDEAFGQDLPDDVRASVREELGLGPDARLVGLVGRLAPDKGQEVLMRALPAIREAVPECHALLVGTGGDYDRQLALRDELGLSRQVHFTLFRTDVARLTAACDVCVLAATDCDASSTVLKEAMSLGVPVVGTDVGGTGEILADGACGAVIPPADADALAAAVVSTLQPEDEAALREQVERARSRVEQEYAMSAVAAATVRVYQEAWESRCR